MTEEAVRNYFSRIKFTGSAKIDLYTLSQLQRLHLLNIPFENLDIYIGNTIILNIESFYKKIVLCKRGGFCYELNGLFKELLSSIGFNAYLVSARVFETPDTFGDEFDHVAIIVNLDRAKWLVDVGFGEFAFDPLKISKGEEYQDERGLFRINQFNNNYLAVQKKTSEKWNNEYLFSMKPRELDEFADKCEYHQTSPKSNFTGKKLCSIPFNKGRITLTDKILKITRDGNVEESEIWNESEFNNMLKIHFNIEL
jgi:N-hydroxyarylamine O-acetyltransferase